MLRFVLPDRRHARVSDERIHAILRAGEDADVAAAELCAVHGLTIPEYCVLKKRYGGLSLDELRLARRREGHQRTIRVTGAALAICLLTATALSSVSWRSAPAAGPARDGASTPPAARSHTGESSASAAATPGLPRTVAPSASAPAPPTPAGPAATAGRPLDLPSADGTSPLAAAGAEDEGYAVQVAAVPDARAARLLVEHLEAAGYPAYVRASSAGASGVFRVRVGPFRTRRQAHDLLPELVRDGYGHAWITR